MKIKARGLVSQLGFLAGCLVAVSASADPRETFRVLIHRHVDADLAQRGGGRQAADPCPDDNYEQRSLPESYGVLSGKVKTG